MVEIKKGNMTLTVPAGAVRKYARAGWQLASESKSEVNVVEPTNTPLDEDESVVADSSESEEEDVEYVDPEELAMRPLEELDREELRILAEYKGIDVSEINSTKRLRAALKALE